MRVGISANPHKAGAGETVERLRRVLAERGISVVLERETAGLVKQEGGVLAGDLMGEMDVMVVLGGDGTMMHALAKFGTTDKPVAGVNIGTLGFLTSCKDTEIEELADALKDGSYETSRRTLLTARVFRDGEMPREFLALNEVVLARGQTGRLVSLSARVDGELLNHYRADGLIVATPTGSTAYSLSAGGPLISPTAGVFVITPVCPHTLSQRSLVVDDSRMVELSPEDPGDGPMLFTVDGRDCVEICKEDRIEVRKAEACLNLLMLNGRSFYGALRKKLNWRGG